MGSGEDARQLAAAFFMGDECLDRLWDDFLPPEDVLLSIAAAGVAIWEAAYCWIARLSGQSL